MFKNILLALASLMVLFFIAALFVDGKVHYERSICIKAPIEKVWANTNSLSAMNKWSPWLDLDRSVLLIRRGNDGEVGSTLCWDSEKSEVGSGCQTLKSIQRPYKIETDLKFFAPTESNAQSYVRLTSEPMGTKATWGFNTVMPYPGRIMKLFTDMESGIGKEYQLGLERLKKLSEMP